MLWSLEQGKNTRITDRFHLGGPTDVRGFREFGIGPKDGGINPLPFKYSTPCWNCDVNVGVGDAVGGEAYFAWSAGVLFPVPNAPVTWPIRLQAFVNAGSLLPLNQGTIYL
jgi:outer membrane protein insertion porin family